ncbi:hypothetical protein DPEC_G00309000 [Dallia pectoralis]|uniref:Uncharacterized protein n=1 Tax=Dallia pectoralis TaxID=75939 RepID=A0ACC2FET0_DALPE|nr:hypothetical protein DPEC_G00309000 [Dallia pectoralis]
MSHNYQRSHIPDTTTNTSVTYKQLHLDLVRFQQLHPLTKRLFVIFLRGAKYNRNKTRKREGKDSWGGGGGSRD